MKKLLVIITKGYPFGKGEPFLENEITHYKGFDKVVFLPLLIKDGVKRDIGFAELILPKRISTINKFLFFFNVLFIKDFYSEILLLVKTKRLSIGAVFDLVLFINHGRLLYKKFIKWYKKNSYFDEITLYSYWMHFNAYSSLLIKKYIGKNVFAFTRCHRFDLYEELNKNKYIPLRKKIFSNIDIIVSISDDGVSYLNQKYGLPTDSMRVSRLGAKSHNMYVKNYTKQPSLMILSCSRLTKIKRVNLIVEAIDELKDFDVKWNHVGDGPEMQNIEKMIEEKNLNEIITLVGSIPNTEVYDYYSKNNYDIFVNVSSSEGIPVSIMEAMSFGFPVIATSVGGNQEIVINGYNGYLIDKDFQTQDLVNAIKKIIKMSQSDYLSLRSNARSTFELKYNAQDNYEKFVNSIHSKFI